MIHCQEEHLACFKRFDTSQDLRICMLDGKKIDIPRVDFKKNTLRKNYTDYQEETSFDKIVK